MATYQSHVNQRDRSTLLDNVWAFWVEGVLEKSLHQTHPSAAAQADTADRLWDIVLEAPDRKEKHTFPPDARIADVFDQADRALLIMGQAGAGKTTTLLTLACDLINRAREDPSEPIPVVLDLFSWDGEQPFVDWLTDELETMYGVQRETTQTWVTNGHLLLLLDGLGETGSAFQTWQRVKAIGACRKEHPTQIALCSTPTEHQSIAAEISLRGVAFLRPLTSEQIDNYLAGAGAELDTIRTLLQNDAPLQQLAQSPLTLTLIALAYKGMSSAEIPLFDSAEAQHRHLLGAHVQRMLDQRDVPARYPSAQTIRRLAWLAQKMTQHQQTLFMVRQIGSSWLDRDWQRKLCVLGALQIRWAVTIALVFGFIRELIAWSTVRLPHALLIGAIFGLIYGSFDWLTIGTEPNDKAIERLSRFEITMQRTRSSGARLIFQIVAGLVLISAVMLYGGVPAGLFLALVWIWWSFTTAIGRLILPRLWGQFPLEIGGIAAMVNTFVCLTLVLSGHIPLNYARFLDYAAERNLLRKVGRRYMFAHSLLMEYFAELEV